MKAPTETSPPFSTFKDIAGVYSVLIVYMSGERVLAELGSLLT